NLANFGFGTLVAAFKRSCRQGGGGIDLAAARALQAATAGLEWSSPLLRRLSMLSAPAPNAAICRSPPAIITFLRKWIIWFWSAKLLWNETCASRGNTAR